MSEIINLPCSPIRNAIHWGHGSNFERFANKGYFLEPAKNNKHIITNVKYEPDSVYQRVDGMAGCCWLVDVQEYGENTQKKYYIRNWIDIVHHYEQKGFKFVEN
jgi:hypothetical protein